MLSLTQVYVPGVPVVESLLVVEVLSPPAQAASVHARTVNNRSEERGYRQYLFISENSFNLIEEL
jgi:hypothetical protein